MASYVVMEPPARGEEESALLVRDGFHVLAFLLPAVWLLFHRLWIEALVAIAAALALGALGATAGFGPASSSALSFLVALYVGMEGSALKLAALRRRGWREWGVVEAENARDAEIRYLAQAFDGEDEARSAPSVAARPAASQRTAAGPALGMLAYPGRG